MINDELLEYGGMIYVILAVCIWTLIAYALFPLLAASFIMSVSSLKSAYAALSKATSMFKTILSVSSSRF